MNKQVRPGYGAQAMEKYTVFFYEHSSPSDRTDSEKPLF